MAYLFDTDHCIYLMKATLSKIGIIIPDIDLLIASTAKYHDMVLVANDKHMKNLPNSFVRENWAKV